MFLNKLLKEYKGGNYSTITDLLQDVISDCTDNLDSELGDLIRDVESGHYSNSEIAERLRELRAMIY